MNNQPLKILVVEDNPGDVRLLKTYLNSAATQLKFEVTHADRLSAALELLDRMGFDAILLDLGLPDGQGSATFNPIQTAAAHTPILILTGLEDDSIARELVQSGAQDYLIKGRVDDYHLPRAISFAIERKRTEEALQASEARFRGLFDNTPIGVLLADPQGNILEVNPATLQILGSPSAEATRQINLLHFQPLIETGFSADFQECARTARPFSAEYLYMTKWGKSTDLNIRSVPILDAHGKTVFLQILLEDITEHRQVEEALRKSEDKFKYIFDHSVTGKSITQVAGEINANQAFCNILGYTSEELKNRKWQEITHPEDVELTQTEINALLSNQRESTRFIKRYLHKNGSVIWAEVGTALRRDAEGKPLYFMTSINDITERKQAEEALRESEDRYRRLTEAITDYIYTVRVEQGRALETRHSAGCVAVTGYTIDEFAADPYLWYRMLWPEERQLVEDQIQRMLTGKETVTIEHRITRKNGAVRWIKNTLSPHFDNRHELVSYDGLIQDITERKQAEDALRESEENLHALLDAILESVLLIKTDGSVVAINPTTAERLHSTVEQLIGRNVYDFLPPEMAKFRRKYVEQVIATGQAVWFEDPRGERIMFNSIAPIFDATGRVERLAIFGFDVTARKQAEETLQEAKEYAESLIKTANTMVVGMDLNGNITDFNQAAETITGYTRSELQNRNWFEVIAPKDRYPYVWAEFEKLSSGGLPKYFENPILTKTGEERYIVWNNNEVLEKGKIVGSISFGMDITARKQAEEALRESQVKLQAIMDYSPALISIKDLNGNIILANRSLAVLDAPPPNELIGKNVFDLFPKEVAEQLWSNDLVALEAKAPVRSEEVVKHKDGNWHTYLTVKFPIYLQSDQPFGICAISSDITERKQAEEATKRHNEMLLALHNVTLEMGAELHLPVLLENILEHAQTMLAADRGGGIYLHEAKDDVIQLAQGSGINQGREGVIVKMDEGVVGRVIRSPQPLVIDDYTHWEGHATVLVGEPPSTVLGVPLFLKSRVIGVLTLIANSQLRKFNEQDVEQAEIFAAQAAVAIQNAQYYQQAQAEITERKQAEAALRESESFSQAILDNSPIGISVRSRTGRLLSANAAWKKIWAMPESDLLEDRAQERKTLNFDARDAYLEPNQEEVRRVYEQGGYLHLPELKTAHTRPGSAEWISQHFYAIQDGHGQVKRVVILTEDITERKRAEASLRDASERLAHMLANSPTVIYALKVEGGQANPIWISANIEAVLGFSAEAGLKPEWWPGQVYPEDRPGALAALEHLLDDFYQHEYRFLRKDGQLIWLHDEHRLLRDAEHQPWEIIGAWTDITARKQAEETLREYNTRLETEVNARTSELRETQEKLIRHEKLAVLGQLAGSVGHELRNPLGIINNAIYYLRMVQPEADETLKEYLGIIETETHTADKIISDLLDFSRIKSVDVEPVAVPDLIQRTLERFPAPENVQVTLNLPENLPTIYVDLRQITQVLGNLVLNACQAMPKGGKLSVSSNQLSVSTEHWLLITVRDTGVGIPPENIKKLFEPLFTTKAKGIGLGLAVSKKLVEANGGRIEVESDPGVGTTFTVYLPVHPQE